MLRQSGRRLQSILRRGARQVSTAPVADLYREYGHLYAKTDPLGLTMPGEWTGRTAETRLNDLGEPDAQLEAAYCKSLAVEFSHLERPEEREWFKALMEDEWAPIAQGTTSKMNLGERRNTLRQLLMAEALEQFLARKYVTLKRYSGEGAEAMMPCLSTIFQSSAAAAAGGQSEVVIGMPHRGRLAFLVSLMQYPARNLFWKLLGNNDLPDNVDGLDDVSSHVAGTALHKFGNKSAYVTLLHNPSHLEAVGAAALGKARSRVDRKRREAGVEAGRRSADPVNALHPTSRMPAGGASVGRAASGEAGLADAMSSTLCVQVHGDGAFSGQGVVAETLAMSQLPGYSVGGSIHLVVNNQLGFTAAAREGRSTTYCTDVAKGYGCPVLHVNAEDVEAVKFAADAAVRYRAQFHRDIVIDLVGYRKHGHNELDQASFTQPRMYEAIENREQYPELLAKQMVADGQVTQEWVDQVRERFAQHLQSEFEAMSNGENGLFTAEAGSMGLPGDDGVIGPAGQGFSAFDKQWSGMRMAGPEEVGGGSVSSTGVATDRLAEVGRTSVTVAGGVEPHGRLQRQYINARLRALEAAEADAAKPVFDWATAEAMAFGTLLQEGNDVRMSGQDSRRGTFSHRHAALVCQQTGAETVPLNAIAQADDNAGQLHVASSHLSEFAVTLFEYGYSIDRPNQLNLWEAQFGDFSNGAQITFDNFVSGSETKWLRQTGLVALFPHGFDGAGPEHSSARIERWLQLSNSQDLWRLSRDELPGAAADKTVREAPNMHVVNPSEPANYFHALRRQVVRPFRKPMIVIAPKTVIRLPTAVSALADMGPDTAFQPVLADPAVTGAAGRYAGLTGTAESPAKRVVLCSGKTYYDLVARRAATEGDPAEGAAVETALVRLEELAPFPADHVRATLAYHFGTEDASQWNVEWAQEEPANAGAWTWVEAHLRANVPGLSVKYHGRPSLAAAAVGTGSLHKVQVANYMQSVFPQDK